MSNSPPLLRSFNLHPPELVSIVGGGGKTTLMFALAQAIGGGVITTTTTRIFAAQMKLSPAVVTCDENDAVRLHAALDAALAQHGQCLVIGPVTGEKATGVPPHLPAQLLARPDVNVVLVEADGSRMKPIKAPAEHEPVIPVETTLLIPVVGIDALDGPLSAVAHRPQQVVQLLHESKQYSVSSNQSLSAEQIAYLLTHPQGGMKNAPPQAQVAPFINKVETAVQLTTARRIAHYILRRNRGDTDPRPPITRVLIGALQSGQPVREVHTPVTAVILAAGEGKRMGGVTKQLLPWGDTTVLGQTIRHARQTAVHHVLVVCGHAAQKIEAVAHAEGAEAIHNPHYAAGEMLSSLQTAVRHLPKFVSAVLVMLADQPMVQPQTIDQILTAYWRGESDLIAPVHNGRRGNPVLIGQRYFDELLALPPGDAPRTLLRRHRHALHLVNVATDAIHRDLDRPEDYERWRP